MKKQITIIALTLIWLTALSKELTPDGIDHKADFIFKAVDYVTWPDGAGTNDEGKIVIAVVGESPLTPKLTELATKKTGKGNKVVVVTKTLENDLTNCQVLFMATEDKGELAQILKKVKDVPVLTVSDCDYFARYGTMINFYKEEGESSVKFEVNTMTLKFAGLKMSSRLLKLATVI